MFIRLFAHVDDNNLGQRCSKICTFITDKLMRHAGAAIGQALPVRVIPVRVGELQVDAAGHSTSCWDKHRGLFTTPMTPDFINVICGTLEDCQRFWTANVMNIAVVIDGASDVAVQVNTAERTFAGVAHWGGDDEALIVYPIEVALSMAGSVLIAAIETA